jgi:2-methylcitrate dehydratase PrpD
MRIHLSDGKEVYGSLAAPKGSYKNPLTESELHEKFYRLGRSVLDDDKLSSVIASVEGIEKSDDVGVISSLMTAAA